MSNKKKHGEFSEKYLVKYALCTILIVEVIGVFYVSSYGPERVEYKGRLLIPEGSSTYKKLAIESFIKNARDNMVGMCFTGLVMIFFGMMMISMDNMGWLVIYAGFTIFFLVVFLIPAIGALVINSISLPQATEIFLRVLREFIPYRYMLLMMEIFKLILIIMYAHMIHIGEYEWDDGSPAPAAPAIIPEIQVTSLPPIQGMAIEMAIEGSKDDKHYLIQPRPTSMACHDHDYEMVDDAGGLEMKIIEHRPSSPAPSSTISISSHGQLIIQAQSMAEGTMMIAQSKSPEDNQEVPPYHINVQDHDLGLPSTSNYPGPCIA